jgi:hypothetical protein
MTLCGHHTYIETSSTLSHMVTPLVVYSAMSSAITRVTDWYESTMNILTKDLFPTPHHRYSNLRLHVCTRDPYYTRSSLSGNDLFRNISMSGSTRTAEMDADLVYLHLNFETKNIKIGMLDSGCNNVMQVLTDDIRDCVMHFDTNGRITGDQVNGNDE